MPARKKAAAQSQGEDPLDLPESLKAAVQLDRIEPLDGKKVCGKGWKDNKQRWSSTHASRARQTLEEKSKAKRELDEIKSLEKQLIEERKSEKRAKRQREEENKKRKELNEMRSQTVQIISSAKVKKMTKKQRRDVKMMDIVALQEAKARSRVRGKMTSF